MSQYYGASVNMAMPFAFVYCFDSVGKCKNIVGNVETVTCNTEVFTHCTCNVRPSSLQTTGYDGEFGFHCKYPASFETLFVTVLE